MVLLFFDFLFIVTPIVGVCNCSMSCCTLLYVHCSITVILMGKRELVALLNLSSWCLVMVERLFLAVPWGCLRFVIMVFPDHTYLLFFKFQLILCFVTVLSCRRVLCFVTSSYGVLCQMWHLIYRFLIFAAYLTLRCCPVSI